MRTFVLGLVLAGLASPALACMNDVESSQHEREFRSQYGEPMTQAPAPSAVGRLASVVDPGLAAVGAACLTGALFLTANKRAKG